MFSTVRKMLRSTIAPDGDASVADARAQHMGTNAAHQAWTNRTSAHWKDMIRREEEPGHRGDGRRSLAPHERPYPGTILPSQEPYATHKYYSPNRPVTWHSRPSTCSSQFTSVRSVDTRVTTPASPCYSDAGSMSRSHARGVQRSRERFHGFDDDSTQNEELIPANWKTRELIKFDRPPSSRLQNAFIHDAFSTPWHLGQGGKRRNFSGGVSDIMKTTIVDRRTSGYLDKRSEYVDSYISPTSQSRAASAKRPLDRNNPAQSQRLDLDSAHGAKVRQSMYAPVTLGSNLKEPPGYHPQPYM
ncbi:hypothetical protein CYMTET_6958 [Cymbomonas tetramitiformis]|uniref:Uncharacterized protein n=1 Tax=Cymbomonas tetramitiformis TaxID=36881 RepID=A0AAE0GW53_9CHLO|nr:hypothetical protein CYMTET_6958 [Cymbomonas tetramitiformis]